MKLEFAILAENADRLEDGRLVIFGGDFNLFQVSQVPATIPFCLVCKLSTARGEPLSGHQFKLEIENPAGERQQMSADGAEIAFGQPPSQQLPSIAHVFTRLIIKFSTVGLYSVYVMVNDTEMARVLLLISLVGSESEPSESQQ